MKIIMMQKTVKNSIIFMLYTSRIRNNRKKIGTSKDE